MNPKSTSAAESMLARTGRRIAVSDSFICDNFPRRVNGPDRPQRNGTCPTLVPRSSASTSKENVENRHSPVLFLFEIRGPKIYRNQQELARTARNVI